MRAAKGMKIRSSLSDSRLTTLSSNLRRSAFHCLRQQADTLQHELEKEVRSHAVLVGSHVINNLRAELDTLCQKMAKDINAQQQENTGDVRARREEKCEDEPVKQQ